jgi:hypothetical protein
MALQLIEITANNIYETNMLKFLSSKIMTSSEQHVSVKEK